MGRYSDRLRAFADALTRFTAPRNPGQDTVARLNFGPPDLGASGNWEDCHSIDLTDADLARIMRMLEDSDVPEVDADSLNQRKQELVAWMSDHLERNQNSQADRDAFLAEHTEMAADITDLFLDLDPREINRTVLDRREVDLPTAVRALDDVFGEIADPYADEDDA